LVLEALNCALWQRLALNSLFAGQALKMVGAGKIENPEQGEPGKKT
jgi:hypothetical protein